MSPQCVLWSFVDVSHFIICSLRDPLFEMRHMQHSWEGGKEALTSMDHGMCQKQKSLSSNLVTSIAYWRDIIKQRDATLDGFRMHREKKKTPFQWSVFQLVSIDDNCTKQEENINLKFSHEHSPCFITLWKRQEDWWPFFTESPEEKESLSYKKRHLETQHVCNRTTNAASFTGIHCFRQPSDYSNLHVIRDNNYNYLLV